MRQAGVGFVLCGLYAFQSRCTMSRLLPLNCALCFRGAFAIGTLVGSTRFPVGVVLGAEGESKFSQFSITGRRGVHWRRSEGVTFRVEKNSVYF